MLLIVYLQSQICDYGGRHRYVKTGSQRLHKTSSEGHPILLKIIYFKILISPAPPPIYSSS